MCSWFQFLQHLCRSLAHLSTQTQNAAPQIEPLDFVVLFSTLLAFHVLLKKIELDFIAHSRSLPLHVTTSPAFFFISHYGLPVHCVFMSPHLLRRYRCHGNDLVLTSRIFAV